jgi:hypothetical protein
MVRPFSTWGAGAAANLIAGSWLRNILGSELVRFVMSFAGNPA